MDGRPPRHRFKRRSRTRNFAVNYCGWIGRLSPTLDSVTEMAVGRRAARAILIDDEGRLILIKRTKAGRAPYWVTPGGGVEEADASLVAALYRELAEELGATAMGASQVFLSSSPSDAGVAIQYFFVVRLISLDESARSGPEFTDPSRGVYEPYRVDLRGDELASIDLKPAALKEFILANREALLADLPAAGSPDGNRLRAPR